MPQGTVYPRVLRRVKGLECDLAAVDGFRYTGGAGRGFSYGTSALRAIWR